MIKDKLIWHLKFKKPHIKWNRESNFAHEDIKVSSVNARESEDF